jgi:Mg2+ and Co2+ transporter CorA
LKEIVIKLQKTQDRISMISPSKTTQRRQYRRKKRVKRINLSGHYFFNPNLDSTDDQSYNKDEDGPLFNEYIFVYFKDLHDHIIQLNDRIDYYSDTLSSLIVYYLVLNDAEKNQIMTCLSLVSIIFIPLNFLLGLFSMNFENMPPLHWHVGYFLTISIALTAALLMFSFFKWKKWL